MAQRLEPVSDEFQNWNVMCRMISVGDHAGHMPDTHALDGEGVRMGWAGKENAGANIDACLIGRES